MTDRVSHLMVALDESLRMDDMQEIMKAIGMIKHVIAVEPKIEDHVWWSAKMRLRAEFASKLWAVLYPELPSALR